MANTLNVGNGNWATKKDSLLGYNSENNNFKPLPFDFTRASSATVINKEGLIETVGSNEPRIDYKDDSEGALKLEPSRTNSLLQSNQFNTTWATSSGVTITSEQTISPQGINNGWKFEKTAVSYKSIGQSYTSSNETTFSIFAKKGTLSLITLFTSISSGTNLYQRFDLENGIVSTGAGMSSSNIKDYGNGWYRCSSTFTNASVTSLDFFPEFSENNAGYIYIYGAQAEVGSYATSYIPTQGSAVTRLAESCSQTVPDGVIGQTEGVVFMDFIAQNATGQSQSHFWLGASGNEIGLYGGGQFIFYSSGGVSINGGNIVTGQRYKVAFGYKANDYVAYVNGNQVGTDTSATVPTMSGLALNSYFNGTEVQKKNITDFKLYNTRLSNTELQALTQV